MTRHSERAATLADVERVRPALVERVRRRARGSSWLRAGCDRRDARFDRGAVDLAFRDSSPYRPRRASLQSLRAPSGRCSPRHRAARAALAPRRACCGSPALPESLLSLRHALSLLEACGRPPLSPRGHRAHCVRPGCRGRSPSDIVALSPVRLSALLTRTDAVQPRPSSRRSKRTMCSISKTSSGRRTRPTS